MIAMGKSLAQEVASRGITVNSVAPGFIATPMTDALSDEQKERLVANIPGGRLGTPEDVATVVTFLASDEAAYITGQTIHVNGGMAHALRLFEGLPWALAKVGKVCYQRGTTGAGKAPMGVGRNTPATTLWI